MAERRIIEVTRRAGRAVVEAAPEVVEFIATEKFPRLVRNIVFAVMVGVMAYTMVRLFSIVTPAAEAAAGQLASVVGTMLTLMVPIMIVMFVVAIVKALLRWVAG